MFCSQCRLSKKLLVNIIQDNTYNSTTSFPISENLTCLDCLKELLK